MMKRFLLIGLLCWASVSMVAQIADIWATMPDSICPYLVMQQRHYMAENAKVGLRDTLPNRMEGHSVIDSLNVAAKYIRVSISPTVTQELFLRNDTIVLVHTLCAPICTTFTRYYNFTWKLLGYEISPFDPALTDEQKILFL